MPFAPHRPTVVATALALLLVLTSPAALAQYRWRDSRGQLHASDQPPPPNIPDKDVLQRPLVQLQRPPAPTAAIPAVSAASAIRPAPVDPELQARRARAEQDAEARTKVAEERAAAQRSENCGRARQQLATLQSGNRLVRVNDKGERVVLDDAARAGEMAQVRSVMATDCR